MVRTDRDLLAELIWNKYYGWFRRQTRDAALADDLCQQLWLKVSTWLVNRAANDNAPAEFSDVKNMLGVSSRHVLCEWARSKPTKQTKLAESFDESTTPMAAPVRTCDEKLLWGRLVRGTLDRLLKNDKERYILATLLHEDTVVVAEHLEMTVGALMTNRCRLLARLQKNPGLRQLLEEAA